LHGLWLQLHVHRWGAAVLSDEGSYERAEALPIVPLGCEDCPPERVLFHRWGRWRVPVAARDARRDLRRMWGRDPGAVPAAERSPGLLQRLLRQGAHPLDTI